MRNAALAVSTVIFLVALIYFGLLLIPSERIPNENIKCWHKNRFGQLQDIAWRIGSNGICEEYSTMPLPIDY